MSLEKDTSEIKKLVEADLFKPATPEQIAKRPKQFMFGAKDVGCYIDGSFGTDHRRGKLAELVHPFDAKADINDINDEYSDDFNEEYDTIDVLQDHTAEGYYWTFEYGDLCLRPEPEIYHEP